MYSKLYIKYYNFLNKRKSFDSMFNASCIVFFTQVVHVFLLILIFSKLLKFEIPSFSDNRSINKLYFSPIAILWLYLTHTFFSSKLKNKDFEKKVNKMKITNLNFFTLIIMTILIPLFLVIILSGGKIWQ